MKILNVNMTLDPVTGGGSAERTFQMSKFLTKSGVQCTILTTDLGLDEKRIKALPGVEIISLRCISRRFYVPKFSYGHIRRVVAAADVIHLMNHWTFLNAVVYIIARRLKKPYVFCPAGSLPVFGRSKIIKYLYNIIIGRRIVRNAVAHIAISTDETAHFGSFGVEPSRIVHIPNGINEDDLAVPESQPLSCAVFNKGRPFILFVGRLNIIKGPDLLLAAFNSVEDSIPDVDLVYVGPDGGLQDELADTTRRMGLVDRVHLIGYLGGQEKAWAYHAAQVLVIPSRQEAMSIVALEAGIVGTPVLLTDQCGFDEIEGMGGGLIVPASVDGLAEGISRMFANRSRLRVMGEKLQNYVKEHYSWNAIINHYIQLYSQIINQERS